MADAANIDPNTGRPIIQIGQKAVKKTMEVSPDGRPVIQIGPKSSGFVPDGESFFVSVGASVTDPRARQLAEETNISLAKLNLANAKFSFFGSDGNILGRSIMGRESILDVPALLVAQNAPTAYNMSEIQSIGYHSSGLKLVGKPGEKQTLDNILRGEGVSANYPAKTKAAADILAFDSGRSTVTPPSNITSGILISERAILNAPERLTSVVSHEYAHNLTKLSGAKTQAYDSIADASRRVASVTGIDRDSVLSKARRDWRNG
jgi:hypothetical protein